jgi:hypothetical protein
MVLVRGIDTICTIQKITHLLYRLEHTDMKNQFLKKTPFHRHPRSASRIRRKEEAATPRSSGGRRPPRLDPTEGGGGDGALDPAEGQGGDDALDLVERGGGDIALDLVEVVVAARPHGR